MISVSVNSWWFFLCAVGAANILAWSLSAVRLYRHQVAIPQEAFAARRWQLFLSAFYVFGCAFRSALPVYDVPRICLYDTWLSSVIVGRSIATIAELCFVAQWAVLLREASRVTGSVIGNTASLSVVPLIAIAEVCSWYSVLTTSNLGHVAEESIWGACAALLVASLVTMSPRCTGGLRHMLHACCVAGIAYAAFMFVVDVPMYWSRWIADEAAGRQYLSITQGLLDVSGRWVVSHRWEDWKNEVPWMSLYFSVAVWFSIALIHTPLPKVRTVIEEQKRLPSAIA